MKTNEIIGMSLLLLGAGAIIYQIVRKGREIGLSDKQNRYLSFSPSYCLSGLSGNITINLPAISEAFYKDYEVPQNRAKLNQIKSQYGLMVSNISNLTNLPETLIYSFIFIESAGNPYAVNEKAIGLMQVGYNSATDIVFTEYKKGRLNTAEAGILQKYLSSRYEQIITMKSPGMVQVITDQDLYNPELNILVGSIYLGQLIDESMENGSLRLDKVVTRYNIGYYSYNKGRELVGDILSVISKLNPITKSYITKLIGVNGILEMLEAEKCA